MRSEMEASIVQSMSSAAFAEDGQRIPYRTARFSRLCHAPQVVLCIFGITKWGRGSLSALYCKLLTAVPAFLCALSVTLALQRGLTGMEAVCEGLHAFGCFTSMVSLQWRVAHRVIGLDECLLDEYAIIYKFPLEWRWISFKRFIVIMTGGALMLSGKLCVMLSPAYYGRASSDPGLILYICDLASSIFTIGFVVALMYCQVHVSSGLHVAVDTCTLRLFSATNLEQAMSEWNLLQAVMRRSAYAVDGSLCCLGLSFLMLFVYSCLRLMQGDHQLHLDGLWYLWMVPPWWLMLYVFYRAVDVTDLCARVPSLINSWGFGTCRILYDAQQAVQYVIQSEAGYYVSGVRITTQTSMKLTYLLCVVVSTVVSRTLVGK